MKHVLIFLLVGSVGFFSTEFIFSVQHQQPNQQVAEKAKAKSFSIEKAPTDSLQGTIATLSGTVNWQSRVATQPAQIKQPRIIQQGEELRTGKDGTVSVQIYKGPLLTLLPNSHVNFIQTLPASIVITQDQGTVTYHAFGKSPLSIESLSLLTSLTNGIMTVSVNQDLDTVAVAVTNGTATEAYNDSTNSSTVVSLLSGHSFLFNDDTSVGLLQ